MKKIVIVANGPTLNPYFSRLLERPSIEFSAVRAWRGAAIPDDFDALILTGDFHNVTDGLEPYHKRELEVLDRLDGRKVFASCFSHQLIAMAHGGRVVRRNERLLRWEEVSLDWEPAAAGIGRFLSVCLNVDEVDEAPSDARLVGTSEGCHNHLLAYGDNVLTCQGHPEMAVKRGHLLVDGLALLLSRGPRAQYREYRASIPSCLPRESPFMNAVTDWLIE